MAAWLVIDWDQDQFHVLHAQTARGGVKVTRAVSWPHPEPFTPSTAERVGKALRDFLKAERIAAAPVIFGLGRDRIFLKELRFPEIAPHEEANLVRFQTGKELTESVENYAVDYVHHSKDGGGERQVLTVAVRRDVVTMIQVLCQGAGLKLHAVTPKLFGVAHALDRAIYPEPSPLAPKALNAVLAVGQRWAELCFFRGRRLLQAQALANGPMLVAEIKRNLAVFQAQHAVDVDYTGPDCLYTFGDDPSDQGTLPVPVRLLNPLAAESASAEQMKNPSAFAGAVGLAELWSASGAKPINLAAPRRQSAPVSVSRQRGIFYGAAAAVVLFLVIGGMAFLLSHKRARIKELAEEKFQQEEFMKAASQERADLEAYKDWEQTTIPWLDELYDLSARHPWEVGFRVNQLTASTVGTRKGVKDAFVAKINLSGYAPTGKQVYVKNLNESMSRDTHVRPQLGVTKETGGVIEYQLKIEVARQTAKDYRTQLIVPPVIMASTPPPKVEPEMNEPDPDDPDAKDAEPMEGGDDK